MKLPSIIKPCPIVEATVGIRFNANCPDDAVFGILYNTVADFFEQKYKVENLPIQQLPPAIRNAEENFKFNPHYKLTKDNEIILIGPHVISLSINGEYPGWDIFYERINILISLVKRSQILGFETIVRVGLRYVNFLRDVNIFQKASINLTSGTNSLNGNQLNITIASSEEKAKTRILISNTAQNLLEGQLLFGSVIDIDVECNIDHFKQDPHKAMFDIHDLEKQKFFNLIGEEYLQEFNPEF